jgi:hypothetical protein
VIQVRRGYILIRNYRYHLELLMIVRAI